MGFFHAVTLLVSLCLMLAGSPYVHAWTFDHDQQEQYTMVHNVTIHQNPEQSSAVLNRVPQGTKLNTVEQVDKGWIRVRYTPTGLSAGQTREGYVEQAFLSSRWLPLSIDDSVASEHLLVAFNHHEHKTQANASILRDGKFVANLDFMVVNVVDEPVYPTLARLEKTGLPEDIILFELKMQPEACGVAGESVLLVYHDDALLVGPRGELVSEAGIFHVDYDFILPGEPEGQKNAIIVKKTFETFDEEAGDYKVEEEDRALYVWDGHQFVLTSSTADPHRP